MQQADNPYLALRKHSVFSAQHTHKHITSIIKKIQIKVTIYVDKSASKPDYLDDKKGDKQRMLAATFKKNLR